MNNTFTRSFFLFLIACTLTRCTVNRYYYAAQEPVHLYEFYNFEEFTPVKTAQLGDTLSVTGKRSGRIGGPVPVEYRGYQFYSPVAPARFLYAKKVNPRKDKALPGITYLSRMQQKASNGQLGSESTTRYSIPTTGAAIQTGPRGGRYYINSNGNKTYVPRSNSSGGRGRR